MPARNTSERNALDIEKNRLGHIDNDAIYLARLGWVLQRLGRPVESQAVLEQAIDGQPDKMQIKEQFANILIPSGDLEGAAGDLAGLNAFRGPPGHRRDIHAP